VLHAHVIPATVLPLRRFILSLCTGLLFSLITVF